MAATINGKSTIIVKLNVQNHENGNTNHPNKNNKVSASGVMLRLRLSNIFHFDKPEIGFLLNVLCYPVTKGNIHAAICQSPLIHRDVIFTSAINRKDISSNK